MIRLDSTVRKLTLQLSEAISTAQADFLACWSDATVGGYLGGMTGGESNGTTPVNFVGAPAASTVRDVDFLSVTNLDDIDHTVSVSYDDNGTPRVLIITLLEPGAFLTYTHASGWSVASGGGGGSPATDHGALTGLGDDDHPQYFNEARGDLRYVCENGFENRTSSTISFDNGTRTFTLTPVGTCYLWSNSNRYDKTTPETYVIPDTEGLHFLYYDAAGVLTHTTTFSEALITDYAFVAAIYWDATNNAALILGDERHGREMDSATHVYLHSTVHSQWSSGCAIGDFTIGAGSNDTHAQVSVTAGVFWDEDIKIEPAAKTFPASVPFLYRSGAAGEWRAAVSNGFVALPTGSGRAAYNEYTGATWQLTEVGNNNYTLMHLFATNDVTQPYRWFVGQAAYGTLSAAQEAALSEINAISFGALETLSFEFVAVGTVIVKTANSYSNTVKSRIEQTSDGDNYVDWRAAAGVGGGGGGGPHTLNSFGAMIDSATEKTVPVAADMLPLMDSAAANVTKKLSWLSLRSKVLNAPVSAAATLALADNVTGGTTAQALYNYGTVQSDVTTAASLNHSQLNTAAASFTIPVAHHFFAQQGTIGAGSAVSEQYGFYGSATLTGGALNAAFGSGIPKGTNRYGVYCVGTADNYFGGNVGIGSMNLSNVNLRVSLPVTGNPTSFAVFVDGEAQSDVTSTYYGFRTSLKTAAASFTTSLVAHFAAGQSTFGAGSTVTEQVGFYAQSSLADGGSVRGFRGAIAAGSDRHNLYMSGTADNYLAGRLGIGIITPSAAQLHVASNITGSSSSFGVRVESTIQSDVTNTCFGIRSSLSTAATSFNLSLLAHFYATTGSVGAGSSITEQVGVYVPSVLAGAASNYAFRGTLTSGSGKWNLYMNGSADNYLAGGLGIGATSFSGYKLYVSGKSYLGTALEADKTVTAGGTTGARTINKPAGTVNFAAAATSLVVTNSLVTANSIIIATVGTNDATMTSVAAVAAAGSFTLHANAAATAETRVNFLVIN